MELKEQWMQTYKRFETARTLVEQVRHTISLSCGNAALDIPRCAFCADKNEKGKTECGTKVMFEECGAKEYFYVCPWAEQFGTCGGDDDLHSKILNSLDESAYHFEKVTGKIFDMYFKEEL